MHHYLTPRAKNELIMIRRAAKPNPRLIARSLVISAPLCPLQGFFMAKNRRSSSIQVFFALWDRHFELQMTDFRCPCFPVSRVSGVSVFLLFPLVGLRVL